MEYEKWLCFQGHPLKLPICIPYLAYPSPPFTDESSDPRILCSTWQSHKIDGVLIPNFTSGGEPLPDQKHLLGIINEWKINLHCIWAITWFIKFFKQLDYLNTAYYYSINIWPWIFMTCFVTLVKIFDIPKTQHKYINSIWDIL